MAVSRFNPDYPDAGLVQVVPTSVAVGSGSGSADGNGAITFSGASSVSINGCFSSNYNNYKIIIDISPSTGMTLSSRLRVSGSDNTTSNYNAVTYAIENRAVAEFSNTSEGGTSWLLGNMSFSDRSHFDLSIFEPNVSQNTGLLANIMNATTTTGYKSVLLVGAYDFKATTVFDSITFYTSTGTITGTVRVYGYRN